MDPNPQEWTRIPLDDDALAAGAAIDERLKAERHARVEIPEEPSPVELSFVCRNITVTGFLGAKKIAHAFDQVVSLGTPEEFEKDLLPGHPSSLRLWFDDVVGPLSESANPEFNLPTEADIRDVFAFAERDKSTLIHCKAGMSRSPAMAVLLACHWDYPMEEILSGLNIYRVYPNKLLLALGEAVLRREPGSITAPVVERLRMKPAVNPPLPVFRMDEDGTYKVTPS
jgi:predicted protein tyrosine phosphatase